MRMIFQFHLGYHQISCLPFPGARFCFAFQVLVCLLNSSVVFQHCCLGRKLRLELNLDQKFDAFCLNFYCSPCGGIL